MSLRCVSGACDGVVVACFWGKLSSVWLVASCKSLFECFCIASEEHAGKVQYRYNKVDALVMQVLGACSRGMFITRLSLGRCREFVSESCFYNSIRNRSLFSVACHARVRATCERASESVRERARACACACVFTPSSFEIAQVACQGMLHLEHPCWLLCFMCPKELGAPVKNTARFMRRCQHSLHASPQRER